MFHLKGAAGQEPAPVPAPRQPPDTPRDNRQTAPWTGGKEVLFIDLVCLFSSYKVIRTIFNEGEMLVRQLTVLGSICIIFGTHVCYVLLITSDKLFVLIV